MHEISKWTYAVCILDPWACYSKGGWGETQAFRMQQDGVPKRLWETETVNTYVTKQKRGRGKKD